MRIAATPVGVLTEDSRRRTTESLGAAPKFSAAVLRPNAPAILAATEGYASEARLFAVLGDQGGSQVLAGVATARCPGPPRPTDHQRRRFTRR